MNTTTSASASPAIFGDHINHDAGRVSGATAFYNHADGSRTGPYLLIQRERPFEPARIRTVAFGFAIKSKPTPHEEVALANLKARNLAILQSDYRRAKYVFDIVYETVLKACEKQEDKDRVNAIYVRCLTKQALPINGKWEEQIKAISDYTEELNALGVFQGRYPILSPEEITAQMVDLS